MDIFTLLNDEHDQIRDVLNELLDTSEDDSETRESLFAELRETVIAHSKGEDRTFYSRLQDIPELHDQILESREEHELIESMLNELDQEDCTTEQWQAKLEVLAENLEHHIDEEEETIFPKARAAVSRDEANQLAKDMEDAEEDVKEAM